MFTQIPPKLSCCVCVPQTPGCPDAGVSSLPHLWVPVHGSEEVPWLYSFWPVYGSYVGQGDCVFVFNTLGIIDWASVWLIYSILLLPSSPLIPSSFSAAFWTGVGSEWEWSGRAVSCVQGGGCRAVLDLSEKMQVTDVKVSKMFLPLIISAALQKVK